MPKRLTTEEFIYKAKEVHGETYDYSLAEYVDAKTKVKIVCKTHGIFEQIPKSHSLTKCGCPKCYGNTLKTTDQFIKEAAIIHGDKYDYSNVEYTKAHGCVNIVCKIHGIFSQTPSNHLRGQGCPVCAQKIREDKRRSTLVDFISKSNAVHDNKYDYSGTIYHNNILKVEILCPYHGSFFQRPSHHLNGTGCPKCGNYLGNFRKLTLSKNHNDLGILYIIRMRHTDFSCLKIGITTKTIRKRYAGYSDFVIQEVLDYQFKISDLCYIEQILLRKYNSYKFIPTIKFDGYTECLTDSENLILKIKKDIENYEHLINTKSLL